MSTIAERVGRETAARMAAIAAETPPALVTIPNVELAAVGEWETATTGHVTFSEADLAAAVSALADPSIKAPRLRIGHTSPDASAVESAGGFADQPAFGRFVNLRLADNGTKIVADMAGVPGWLAEVLPSAFPSRSIEAYRNVTTAAGRKHDMVITSVALLGVSLPAVQTLEDLRIAYGAETPEGTQLQFVSGDRVAATRGGVMPKRVSASVTYTDVRRSFYEDFATDESGRYWWWICDFVMSPATAIVDDDEGGLWSVPYSISGDTITWGEPVEVRIQYVEVASGKVAASRGQSEDGRVFASAAESRPKDRVRAATDNEGGTTVAPMSTAVLERLGLPEDATEEDALAKLDELKGEEPETPDESETPEPEEDDEPASTSPEAIAASGVTVDKTEYEELKRNAAMGRQALETQQRETREQFVDAAVKAGKFPPSRRDHYLGLMTADEKGTREFIDGLAEGAIPVSTKGVGAADDTTHLKTQVAAGLAAAGVRSRKES